MLGVRQIIVCLLMWLFTAALATPVFAEEPLQSIADRLIAAGSGERGAILDQLNADQGKSVLDLLHKQAGALMDKGEYGNARIQTEAELAVARRFGTPRQIMAALGNSGLCLERTGDPPLALALFREELALAEKHGLREVAADSWNQIGVASERIGRFDDAGDALERSLALQRELKDQLGIARSLNNLGLMFLRTGELRRAAETFQQCLKLSEEIHSDTGVAFSLNNLASLYLFMAEEQLAIQYLDRSLELKRKLGNKRDIASTLQNLSIAHHHLSNNGKALEYANENLKLAREIGNPAYLADPLVNRGGILEALGRVEDALRDLNEALDIGHKYLDPTVVCEANLRIAGIQMDRGEFKKGLAGAHECLRSLPTTVPSRQRRHALFLIGVCNLKLQHRDAAIAAFEESANLTDAARNQLIGGLEQSGRFLANKTEPYQALIGLYLDAQRPYDALAMAERVKGRVLLDALRRGKVEVTKSMTASEKEREKALNARIATLNRELLRQRPGTPAEAAVRARLEDTQRQGRQFETELYATHPELRAQRAEFEPLSKPQMLALAPDEQTALVEFAVLHEAVITFVLTREGSELALRVHQNKIEDHALPADVEALRKQIVGRDPGYRKAAAKLYARLLGAAEADLQGKKTIVVIPDDVLWRVPFPALITSRGRHLIEEKTIFYANSLAVLWEETQRARAPRAERLLLAMGNPTAAGEFAALPNAEKEAQALGKMYGNTSTRVYVGAEAREDRFKSDASRFRIVHLATHGLLNDANPLYSYVLLSHGTDKEDGLLEAREILNLDLHADLVILSACQTAEGRISSGEGMIGMSWALQVAGSSAALVTQWSVDSESTTELMTGFHRRLRSRMQPNGDLSGKASALRDAAIDLMKSPQFRHPFYWSAFALVGAGY